jgi:pimeloyl-ACP methyl ester carboxylesterase
MIARLGPLLSLVLLALPTVTRAEPAGGIDFSGPVDIGDRRLFLTCKGKGSPTVILVSGYRNNAEIWTTPPEPGLTPVFLAVAKYARVCAYDRPWTILDAQHLSRSDPVPMPRTADAVVFELHFLLEAAKLPHPYVLDAHSLGGLFARLYAATYPGEVVGLVLVDAWAERLPKLMAPRNGTLT